LQIAAYRTSPAPLIPHALRIGLQANRFIEILQRSGQITLLLAQLGTINERIGIALVEINRGVESDDPSLSAANTTLGLEADFGQLESLLN
jgi:hypothetical protein